MIENRFQLFLSVIEIVVRGGLALKAYNKALTEGIKLIFSLISMENYHMKRPSRCCCNGANCRAVGVKTGLCSYVTSSMNSPYRLTDTEKKPISVRREQAWSMSQLEDSRLPPREIGLRNTRLTKKKLLEVQTSTTWSVGLWRIWCFYIK